jgi:glycosyltransferase involved in cell wall biosynthesis
MTLKIAFATPYYHPLDVLRGSGTSYHLVRELEAQGCLVSCFGPLNFQEPWQVRGLRAWSKRVQRKPFKTYLDPLVVRPLGQALDALLEGVEADLLMTNDPAAAAGTRSRLPLVYYSDVMLPPGRDPTIWAGNFVFGSLPLWALRRCQRTMESCLKRADLLIFPADWQAETAQRWGVDPAKIHVISYGANIVDPGPAALQERLERLQTARPELRLLFIGTDWVLKDGPTALETARLLKESGLKIRMDVVGVKLDGLPEYVRCWGRLNKSNPEDYLKLDRLFRQSDFLILPTRYEGLGIAPREAAAYGLPTLASRIAGVVNSVVDGGSGCLIAPEEGAAGFANAAKALWESEGSYQALCESARQVFEARYNWSGCVASLVEVLKQFLEERGSA